MNGHHTWIGWLGILAILLAKTAIAHPHCVSSGKATWIEAIQSLEVTLQVSVEDLEEILIKQLKHNVHLGSDSAKEDKALEAYIMANLSVTRSDQSKVPAKWIGYEVEDATAWIYVEFAFGQPSMKGHSMQNTILTEAFEEQVNLVNVSYGKQRKTLKFRRRNPVVPLPGW